MVANATTRWKNVACSSLLVAYETRYVFEDARSNLLVAYATSDFLAPWGSSNSNFDIKSLFSSSRDLEVRSKISSKSKGSDPLRNNGLIEFEVAATAKSEDNLLIEIEQFSASNHAENIGRNSSILTDERE